MEAFIERIRAALAKHTPLEPDALKIEQPRDPSLGHFAFPCFPLAKALRSAPPKIAAELREKVAGELAQEGRGIAVEATGPYLNFRVDAAELAAVILGRVLKEGACYGSSNRGQGGKVLVDLCSPNIAKPMHVGHLRSTILGAAIKRLHDFQGYETVGINHIGDWGSQFGKLVVAIERWGSGVDLETDPIRGLLSLYVRYHEEEEQDPSLAEAARAAFQELESGVEGEVRATWRRVTELSLREFDKTCARLGVTFDLVRGESYYEPFLEPTVERIEATGITEISDGALIVDLTECGIKTPCLLRKTDGTTLYATRDFAAAFHRWDEYAFDRCLYVVGSDQRLHFRQLKAVLSRMGEDWEERLEHVDFGMMRLPEGKMSTRKGQVVFLEDVLDQVVAEATRVIAEKNPELAGQDTIAEEVGIGALIFHDLKKERVKDVQFDLDEVLSFEGETGPYVQYTHARLASILRKGGQDGSEGEPDYALLADSDHLILALGRFPAVVASAAQRAEPSELSQYLLGLSRELNSWYTGHRVLGDEAALQTARLSLVRAVKTVISNGLALLGVASPEEM